MREALQAVVEHLRQLKRDGVEVVPVSQQTLDRLRAVVAARNSKATDCPTPLPHPVQYVREEKPSATVGEDAPAARTLPESSPAVPLTPVTARPAKTVEPELPVPPLVVLPAGSKPERWEWLRRKVLDCPVCRAQARLAEGKKIVFGVGNLDSPIFFCGEAPGADEETIGEPFVGRAGQLLDKMIQAMGLSRADVYIGNILNWRPRKEDMSVGNRPPTPAEMTYCLPYLIGQVEVVAPKVIVALGNTAVTGLLGPDPRRKISQIRGHWQDFRGIPLMPTFHPSYLLQHASVTAKRQAWEDLLQVMERVGMPISEKQNGYFLPK